MAIEYARHSLINQAQGARGHFGSLLKRTSVLAMFGAIVLSSAGAAEISEADQVPKGVEASAEAPSASNILKGGAEMTTIRTPKEKNFMAWKASQLYQQGVAGLNGGNYKFAADCFKMAAVGFDQPGCEKFLAQTKYAEAQTRKLLGQTKESARLYQAAIDLFTEFDPLSPYLKGAFDSLAKVAPNLKGKVERDKARADAIFMPMRIMTVDRNVVLKGGLSNYGGKLLAEKALVDVPSSYAKEVIHKAFIKMTCLETTELGSNYTNAENRWYPLLANGKTVAIAASSDFMVPSVSVKINARQYNVGVDLPGLGSNKRTVFLLTDGSHIIAIDPSTEAMWNLDADFKHDPVTFQWRRFTHFKPKRKN